MHLTLHDMKTILRMKRKNNCIFYYIQFKTKMHDSNDHQQKRSFNTVNVGPVRFPISLNYIEKVDQKVMTSTKRNN